MLKKWLVPKTIQWLVKLFIIFFKPETIKITELFPSFWLGLKYDLRWIAIILLPISLLSLSARFTPFYSERNKRIWTLYLSIITLLVLFFYGADFGQFAYVNARLNADALIFAEDPKESIKMVWQSYPVIWIFLAIGGAVLMMARMFRRLHVSVEERNTHIHKFSFKRRWHFAALLLQAWFIYGLFSLQPINIFRAFKLNDEFKSNLALNPLQNFFATLGMRNPDFKTDAVKYFPVIKNFLGLNEDARNYTRIVQPGSRALESQPNIVLVICESFSMYKSSMSGNPLNPTPFFNELCKEGIFFNRCFTPTFGTARGVFATITGIPDVQLSKFATRNEESVNQRTIINNFDGYKKFYFIGGRSQFNNFSGLIRNIEEVKIYEEGSYNAPIVNVWGISDKNLFLQANEVMAKQTADNHRPYKIPEEDSGFVQKNLPGDSLKKYGFESVKEYNAFAYTDYCFQKFIKAAQKEKYFSNTIFVFIGDHGVEGDASFVYPRAWSEQRLSEEHVPLLFYSPHLLNPEQRNETVSQIDVLPTIAGMLQQPYVNSTLGRNLLSRNKKENAAFTIYHASGWIGIVNDHFYYRKNIHMHKEELVPSTSDSLTLTLAQKDSVKRHLSELSTAIYETARWMLFHNKNQ